MSYEIKSPSLSDLNEQGAGSVLEFVCQNPNCRRATYVLGEQFCANATVQELAARARCLGCNGRDVRVFPLWLNNQTYGVPSKPSSDDD